MDREIKVDNITYATMSRSEIVLNFSKCRRFNKKEMDRLIRQLNKAFRNLGGNADLHLFRRNCQVSFNVRGRIFHMQNMNEYLFDDWRIFNVDGDFLT